MEMDTYAHGIPSWVDLGSPDLPATKAFYGGLFGWAFEEGPPEAGGYALAMLKGRTVAGVGPQMNPGPPAWLHYVDVADAAAAAAAVTSAGGTVILPPMPVMTAGTMALFADPLGAVFGVWQAGDHKGAGLVNEPGTFCWSELVTTDTARAATFYRQVFEWDAEGDGSAPHGYLQFELDGRPFAGMMTKPEEMPAEVPPFWGVYFAVADTDAAVARTTELGGSTMLEPQDIEAGRFAVLTDPTGAVFNVIALPAS
jgi:predicted enzyme related to lactoylglutathione lyase